MAFIKKFAIKAVVAFGLMYMVIEALGYTEAIKSMPLVRGAAIMFFWLAACWLLDIYHEICKKEEDKEEE